MHEIIEQLPNRVWDEEDLEDYDLRPNDRKKLLAFSHSGIYQQVLTMEIHKEMPFFIHQKGFRMSGAMDLVAVNKEEVILIDFKTDHAPVEEIRTRYTDQLNAYREALKRMYPNHEISVYAWSFANNIEIYIPEETEAEA